VSSDITSDTVDSSESLSGFSKHLPRISERMVRLAEELYPTAAEQTELAVLCQAIASDQATKDQVWSQLCSRYDFGDTAGGVSFDTPLETVGHNFQDILDQAQRDFASIWVSLQQLAQGKCTADQPTDDQYLAADAKSRRLRLWLQQTMERLDKVLMDYGPDNKMMVYTELLLPPNLRLKIERQCAKEWFGSPYSLGASMQSLPIGGATLFGIRNGPAVLDCLADALHDALERCRLHTSPKRTEAYDKALAQVTLFWMVLQGFVYAAANDEHNYLLARKLVDHTGLLHKLRRVLTEADTRLKDVKDGLATPSSIQWTFPGDSVCRAISQTNVDELLASLEDCVKEHSTV